MLISPKPEVYVEALTVPSAFATNATVVANASSGDCNNVTFETEGDNYESYCVQKNMDVPEIDTVYDVEEELTSTNVISEEQAQKIKIFSINYRDTDLTHNTINPRTGQPVKEIDDVTSRQLVIWDILGQADPGWYTSNHVNKTIIDHINELYDGSVVVADFAVGLSCLVLADLCSDLCSCPCPGFGSADCCSGFIPVHYWNGACLYVQTNRI